MKRIASPVDFISGPSSLFTLGNLLNENTGSLMAQPSSLYSVSKSATFCVPNITLVAMFTKGVAYALAKNGTVREALGLASIT